MNCLSNLITTKFLRNIYDEMTQARTTLTNTTVYSNLPSFFPARPQDRKGLYNRYMKMYEFKSAFDDVTVDGDMVYYLQQEHIVWIASKHKMIIDKAILETAYTTGELCIHSCKHIIQNKALYAAMFDIRMCITPLTTN